MTVNRSSPTNTKHNVTTELTPCEKVHAQLRILISRILRRHIYAEDEQEKATLVFAKRSRSPVQGWTVA